MLIIIPKALINLIDTKVGWIWKWFIYTFAVHIIQDWIISDTKILSSDEKSKCSSCFCDERWNLLWLCHGDACIGLASVCEWSERRAFVCRRRDGRSGAEWRDVPLGAPRWLPTVRLVMQWNVTAQSDVGGLRRAMERNGEAASVVCDVAGGTSTLYLRSALLASGAPCGLSGMKRSGVTAAHGRTKDRHPLCNRR